jgi:hypothetical protein
MQPKLGEENLRKTARLEAIAVGGRHLGKMREQS